jgi:hypothetical protein
LRRVEKFMGLKVEFYEKKLLFSLHIYLLSITSYLSLLTYSKKKVFRSL